MAKSASSRGAAVRVNGPAPVMSNAAPPPQNDKLWEIIFLVSLVVVFISMTVMCFSYGLSGDEVDMNMYGMAILKYFTTLGKDQTVFNMPKVYDRNGVIQYYGGFFDLVCAVINKISPLKEYTTRHLLNAWVGFIAILFSAKLAARFFSKQTGVLCTWLMFLAPFFLGNSMNNPKDIPFAAGYIAAIYFTIRLFDNLPKPRIADYILLILSIGITINIRVGGILLIPYLFVFAGLIYVTQQKEHREKLNVKSWIKPLLIVAVGGYLAGSLFWPYAQKNPIINPLTALHEMNLFTVTLRQMWDGNKVSSENLPANYLIRCFMMTNSYVLILGLLLIAPFLGTIRKGTYAGGIYFIIFTGVFPILYIIFTKSNVYHLWRHVLFAFPSLAIASAGGWYYLSKFALRKNFKYTLLIAGALLLEPLSFIVTSFPNTICYFNVLVGGVEGAYGNYEVDYYYNGLKQSADWFIKNELPKYKPTDTIVIGSNASHLVEIYLSDHKNVKVKYMRYIDRGQQRWDYTLFHLTLIPQEEVLPGTWITKNTIQKTEISGLPLAAITKRSTTDVMPGNKAP